MTDHDALIIFLVSLCMALSFLLSGMESGVLALSRLRVRQLMRAGDQRASVLHGYLENSENFLWTILVGNTLANFVVFSLSAIKLHEWLSGQPLWWTLSFVAAVFIFYILCELLPKTLFQLYPNRLTLILARPFRFVHLALAPFVAIVAWCSRGLLRWTGGKTFTGRLFGNREELRFVMQESAPDLSTEEKTMINRVLDLQSLRVRQATIPLADAVTANTHTPMTEVLELCRARNLTRVPVLNPQTRRVVGVLDLENLVYLNDFDLKKIAGDYLQPALFLNEDLRLEDALRRMQRSGHRLGIVLGRDHREAGIISLQDILKIIFGEVTL